MSKGQSDRTLRGYLIDQGGATAIEYGLIAAGIAAAIMATVSTLGANVNTMWQSISTALK